MLPSLRAISIFIILLLALYFGPIALGAEAAGKRYYCIASYWDAAIQDTPLWEEDFMADISERLTTKKEFEKSPGDGNYFAIISPNWPTEGISAVIINEDTRESSVAVYNDGAEQLSLDHVRSRNAFLKLTCVLR